MQQQGPNQAASFHVPEPSWLHQSNVPNQRGRSVRCMQDCGRGTVNPTPKPHIPTGRTSRQTNVCRVSKQWFQNTAVNAAYRTPATARHAVVPRRESPFVPPRQPSGNQRRTQPERSLEQPSVCNRVFHREEQTSVARERASNASKPARSGQQYKCMQRPSGTDPAQTSRAANAPAAPTCRAAAARHHRSGNSSRLRKRNAT